jgi:hypothetical protein
MIFFKLILFIIYRKLKILYYILNKYSYLLFVKLNEIQTLRQ